MSRLLHLRFASAYAQGDIVEPRNNFWIPVCTGMTNLELCVSVVNSLFSVVQYLILFNPWLFFCLAQLLFDSVQQV